MPVSDLGAVAPNDVSELPPFDVDDPEFSRFIEATRTQTGSYPVPEESTEVAIGCTDCNGAQKHKENYIQ